MIDHAHTAENSLDWNGTYTGILPCADCEGIKTEIELHLNKTYSIKETYLGKSDTQTIHTGHFNFDPQHPSIIKLNQNMRQYFVAEGYLKALDQNGHEIQGQLAEHYQLQKIE